MNRIVIICLGVFAATSYCAEKMPHVGESSTPTWCFDDSYQWYDDEPLMSIRSVFHDLGHFGRNLFTGDALGVIAPFLPFWAASYNWDDRAHRRFYCPHHHRNINQCSDTWVDISECLVGTTIGTLAACSFAVKCRNLQRTAQLYAITLPLTWAAKSLVKQIHWKGNRRPGHANFPQKCHWGGFPSGHMLEMTYATVLFGLSMGPGFAIPLGLSTGIIAATFVQTNRHYISQLVAGAAIGTLFGFAAHWSVSRAEYGAPLRISCGGTSLRASYEW